MPLNKYLDDPQDPYAGDNVDIPKLVRDLGKEDDSSRKLAAFKLQNVIGDPSFADVFIANDGVPKLRFLVFKATGNTLAYTLSSFANLLNLDQGWDWINSELIHRVRALQPSVLPEAMSLIE